MKNGDLVYTTNLERAAVTYGIERIEIIFYAHSC